LPAYKAILEEHDVYVDLQRDAHKRFERFFVCPSASSSNYKHYRRLIAVDGTFLKGRFILILLFAVTIDANNEILILAWAVVESENKDFWGWFFQHLRREIPDITREPIILLSDRDKGLVEAQAILGPRIVPA
jgi:hypothetical protein